MMRVLNLTLTLELKMPPHPHHYNSFYPFNSIFIFNEYNANYKNDHNIRVQLFYTLQLIYIIKFHGSLAHKRI